MAVQKAHLDRSPVPFLPRQVLTPVIIVLNPSIGHKGLVGSKSGLGRLVPSALWGKQARGVCADLFGPMIAEKPIPDDAIVGRYVCR